MSKIYSMIWVGMWLLHLQDDISDQSAADILCEQSIHSIVESHGSDALQVLQ